MSDMRILTHRTLGIITILLSFVIPTNADVIITELMPCNTSTYINDLYNYVGYAELYNDGDDDVDLKGYSFTNSKKSGIVKWTWNIESSCVVKSKEYCLVFFDEIIDKPYHVGYKLDTDGGTLSLTKDAQTVSYMNYTQQYPHVSYGIGENGMLGYMEPSPMASNTMAYSSIKSRCSKPIFSVAPGLKSSAIKLELSTATDSATIYYTTNGDIPVVGVSKTYSTPLDIKNNTVVRAIAVKDSMLKSEMITGSYIYSDAAHNKCNGLTANIVSIVADTKFYNDNMQGMYVDGTNGTTMACITKPKNYAQDWTRAANFEYIVDSVVVVNQEVETSIKGGCSRANPIKSLGIKSNKKSGKKGFDYVFFPEQRPGKEYESLHLRNGGNAYSTVRFRDGFMSCWANALGIDCQAYEPVAAYINGKYMEFMGLRSPSNKSYVKTHYGLDEDEIDFIEMSQEVSVMAGDSVAYNTLISSLRNDDPSSADYYEKASKLMDMDNYLDYQIFEQFIANSDWPGNNQKLWREHKGGKFRWILFDTDFGLGLYSYNQFSKKETDMLKYVLGSPKGTWNTEPWMISPFAELIKNDEFKYRFLIKYMHHLKYSFTESVIDSVWMSISDKIADEYCVYKGSSESAFSPMKTFALGRPANIYKQLKEFYKAGTQISLQVAVKDVYGKLIPNSAILINNEALGGSEYKVDYYAGIPLKVDVRTPAGYQFQRWTLSSKVTDASSSTSVFEGKLSADMVMTAVFAKETNPQPWTLQINEICSSNSSAAGNQDECGHYSDWIEIYNYGAETLDLAGMYITDDSTNMTKYMFPYGFAETKIEPGKCVIVWADDESWRGPLHTNFKISSTGSFIGLAYDMQKEYVYLDSVSCPRISTDDSYGRYDNGDSWGLFCTADGEVQVTFGKPNGSIISDTTSVIQPVSIDDAIVIYPNPANDELNIQTVGRNSVIKSLAVYNTQGVLLRQLLNVNESKLTLLIDDLTPGIYILKAETNYALTHKRFEKK